VYLCTSVWICKNTCVNTYIGETGIRVSMYTCMMCIHSHMYVYIFIFFTYIYLYSCISDSQVKLVLSVFVCIYTRICMFIYPLQNHFVV